MIGVLVYVFFTSPSRIDGFLIVILIILVITAFLALNYLIWQLKGKETLLINQEKIVLKNENTLFINKFEIDVKLIDDIKIINNDSFIKKFWGVFGGKIIIEYSGRNKKFGKDLSINQAKENLAQIKKRLSER